MLLSQHHFASSILDEDGPDAFGRFPVLPSIDEAPEPVEHATMMRLFDLAGRLALQPSELLNLVLDMTEADLLAPVAEALDEPIGYSVA